MGDTIIQNVTSRTDLFIPVGIGDSIRVVNGPVFAVVVSPAAADPASAERRLEG